MRHALLVAGVAVAVGFVGASASLAASCSEWKATCESRGGGSSCEAKFAKCLKTGTWTEGSAFGGGKHSGVTKK